MPTLKNVKVALETLEMLNIGRGHRHLLLNRADDAVGLDAAEGGVDPRHGDLRADPTSIDIAAATNSGVPILTSTPNHPSSAAIRKLAAMFTGDPVTAIARTRSSRRRRE